MQKASNRKQEAWAISVLWIHESGIAVAYHYKQDMQFDQCLCESLGLHRSIQEGGQDDYAIENNKLADIGVTGVAGLMVCVGQR